MSITSSGSTPHGIIRIMGNLYPPADIVVSLIFKNDRGATNLRGAPRPMASTRAKIQSANFKLQERRKTTK